MNKISNLKPERVFYYFNEISKIPRESYNEKEISEYLIDFAKKLSLETYCDERNNVIIRKPAFKGYEEHKAVILQGHTDMVCIKTDESKHDFSKDPIELVVDGNSLRAKDTTLGADNGIAVAMAMAILEDKTLKHGPLEVLLTTSEEVDLGGALFLKENILQGELLINLDSEDEGVITVGCAGGIELEMTISGKKESLTNEKIYKIRISNLAGGHSGVEIHKERENANKIMQDLVKTLNSRVSISLVEISGGTKDNAIPVDAEIVIASKNEIFSEIKEVSEEIKAKYQKIEKNIKICYEELDKKVDKAFTQETLKTYLEVVETLPTGVNTWMKEYPTIVESSSNLAIIRTDEEGIKIISSLRSSNTEVLEKLKEKFVAILDKNGCKYHFSNGYPEWQFKKESFLRDKALEVFKEMYNKEMKVEVIHAGLECGAISKKYPNIDFISIGPDIRDVHTPLEYLDIPSTERVYNYLIKLLESL